MIREPKLMTIHDAAADIYELLLQLSSPREAAHAVAIVRSKLFVAGGAKTKDDVSKMIADDDKAALEIWKSRHEELGH